MTCVKISFRNRATEIDKLKNYHISAWSGRRQKFLIVPIENEGKKENKEFEFKFHHKSITIEHLEYFKRLYLKGELNKLIKFICSNSNELGGFYDYGVEVLRNYVTSRYVFDSRRDGGGNIK